MTRNNSFTLRGFVGNDAEIKTTNTGKQLAQFSLCVEERWQGRDGQPSGKKDWFRVIAWGRQAEIAEAKITKGTLVEVHGRLENRSWTSNGQTHYATDLIVSELVFIDRVTGQPIAEEAEAAQPEAPVAAEEAPKPRRRSKKA